MSPASSGFVAIFLPKENECHQQQRPYNNKTDRNNKSSAHRRRKCGQRKSDDDGRSSCATDRRKSIAVGGGNASLLVLLLSLLCGCVIFISACSASSAPTFGQLTLRARLGMDDAGEATGLSSSESAALSRARRQASRDGATGNGNAESLLTVEWEGIQSGDHPDSSIRGFIVEYRAEKESQWNVHSGVIPYKGPNHQYRVQIPRLPTGISYYVRIKVLGEQNEVLVETPEIRARNEIVSIKCESDEITAPRDVDVKERGQFSVALAWLPPECGSVGEYQIELRGRHSQSFDVHRQTVAQPSASVTGLLPGTEYAVRIRAVDRSRTPGAWNEELVTVSTKGDVPRATTAPDIVVEYRSDREARIRWKHFDDERLQHYEVILVDQNELTKRIDRTRVSPTQHSFFFADLTQETEYTVGVVAYVDHEPRHVYRLTLETVSRPPPTINDEAAAPVIINEGPNAYQIHWKRPDSIPADAVRKYVIEYRVKGGGSEEETGVEATEKVESGVVAAPKWLRLVADRDASEDTNAHSVSATADELADAFSVRVTYIGDDATVVARTRETLVAQGDAAACNGAAGAVRGVHVRTSATTLTYSWRRPECDESREPIVGYEYAIWKQEDGAPPESTSYTEKPSVMIEGLPSDTVFLFRVRSRLANGHSSWSQIVEGLTVDQEEGENIYRLRIVLSPPKSFLVWTPMKAHRDNIASFKLSYKHSGQDEWTTIARPPTEFKCPPNIAEPSDFCYDLKDLEYGKQYTSDLIYELHNSEWTSHGSPLLFILVEAGDIGASGSRPTSLRVSARDPTSVEVRWLPPENDGKIEAYEVTAEEVSLGGAALGGQAPRKFHDRISGSSFVHVFSRLSPHATYNISVRAVSDAWGSIGGEVASEIFSFVAVTEGAGGALGGEPLSSAPTSSATLQLLDMSAQQESGGKVAVAWRVAGDAFGVRAYQVEQKARNGAVEWRPVSGYVANSHTQQSYHQTFDHSVLVAPIDEVELRVRAIGADGNAVALSAPIFLNTECSQITDSPKDVVLVRMAADSVALRWSYPADGGATACGLYFIISGTMDNAAVQQTVDGLAREHRFTGTPAREWQLRVAAANRLGAGSPSETVPLLDVPNGSQRSEEPSLHHSVDNDDEHHHRRTRRSICDPRTDFWCRSDTYSADGGGRSQGALISQPSVTQEGSTLTVRWRSIGNGRGVYGYRVQFRSQNAGWNPFGQIVPYVGDDQEYSLVLTGLVVGVPYQVQVQAVDRNSYVLYTTPEVAAHSNCQPPLHPPSHLAVDSPDSRHVRVTWNNPSTSSWRCDLLQVEIKVDTPANIAAPIIVDARRQNSHILDSAPNQAWTVRARAVNAAGASPWSASVSTRSAAADAEGLIDGPFITATQGVQRLTWRSRANVDPQLVDHYVVEWKPRTAPQWTAHGLKIPYTGWQRPYATDLTQLPRGHIYEVRVRAVDHNLGTAFTSPSVTLQSTQHCQEPPRAPPRNVEVAPIGPTQIRLSWQPIAESEWNCDRVWYVVRYSSPESQGYRNLTQGEYETVFDSKPHTQWHFEIQAANPAGASAWSRAKSSETFTAAPDAVSELNAYPLSADSVQLSWRPPQNPNGVVTGYEVTYQLVSLGMCDGAAANTDDQRVVTVSSAGPSYTLTGLHPHSRYRVGVAARTNIAGERITLEIQTEQAAPTSGPAHIRVDNVAESSAELSWHAPPCVSTNGDITEYEYEVAAAAASSAYGNAPRQSDVVRGTRVPLRALIPGTRYTARVRAFTARGAGPWSPDVQFETARGGAASSPQPVVVPRVVAASAQDAHLVWQTPTAQNGWYDKFTCRWTSTAAPQAPPQQRTFPAYSPCDEAVIRRQQLPPSTPQQQTHCGRLDGLRPDQSYDFQVASKPKNGGWTPWTSPQRTFVPAAPAPPPAPPQVLEPVQIISLTKLGSTPTSLQFAWTVRPTDELRCSAFRISVVPRDRTEPPRVFQVDRNTLQYSVGGLRPNTVYAVTVEPSTNNVYSPGRTVDMSTDAEALFGVEQRPRIIDEKATSITIAWDVPAAHQCSGFIVEYRLENGGWQRDERRVPCATGRRTYTAQVDELPTNSAVDLRVIGVSVTNQPSAPSPEVRGHTKCSAPETAPQALRLDAPTTNEVRATWARPAKSSWNCDQLNVDIGYRVGDAPERVITVPGDRTQHVFAAEPGQRWTVRVRASNQMGASPWGAPQTVATRQGAPGAVLGLRLKPLSANEIRVSWQPPQVQRGTIVGYDISYRLKHRLACQEEEPRDVSRDFLTIYNHKDLDYTLSGLLPNSLYEVRVRARTTELGPEETKEAATLQQPPSAPPLNLQLTYALERSLSFQWEPVDCSQRHGEILNYEYEIVGQDDWAKLERQIANTSDTRVTIDGLTPYTKYVMRVKAYNPIGGGPNTENLDVMTAKANAPLPPQDLVVTQEGTDFFVVSWLPPYPPYGPHDSYKLRYQLLNANQWEHIEVPTKDPRLECPAVGPRLCFNITGLENGQQYRVQVAARIEGGVYGPYSSPIIANTLQILPDAPQAIELIAKTDHSLHIRWIPPVDLHGHITQYRLGYASLAEPNARRETVIVNHPKLDYLIDNLQPETTYNISLSAGTKSGFGPEIWTRYTTDPFRVPSVIAAPTVTADGAHALDVEWTGVADAKGRVAGYIIELRTSDTPLWQEYGSVVRHEPGKSRYLNKLTNLDADTLYFVRIKVVDTRQRISDASPEAQARTGCAAPLSPPTNLNLQSPDWRQVKVSWQSPAKGSWFCSSIRYRVEFTNGTQPVRQTDVPGDRTSHVFDSGPSTEWVIRLQTVNDAGVSAWSEPLRIKTAGGAPSTVTDLRARPTGPTSGEAEWRAPDEPNGEITGYTLVYQLRSIGECGPAASTAAKPITVHAKDERVELTGLVPDATYDVHVTAHTTQPGPKSKVVTLRTEEDVPSGQPRNLRVTSVTSTRAELVWNEIECELRHGKILGYNYELDSLGEWGGPNVSQQTTTHRVSLDALAPYTQYRARVRGQNAKGVGPFTEWVTFQTAPAAPPPPTDLREEELLPHALEISFLPPSPPNGILDLYRVRYTPRDKFNYKEIKVPAFELECSDAAKRGRLCYRITKLEPEQEYEIQVAAHTERGDWSEWSESLFTRTEQQNIPVLEQPLELDFVKSTSIGVKWHGLEAADAEHIVGYVLEYKSEDDADWQEHNGVVRHRHHQADYKAAVRGLVESTEYFFRLRVVGKGDKRGGPGPELKAITKCGRPEQPPSNVRVESVDFETVRFTWDNPEPETWKCDEVELLLQYSNSSTQGTLTIPLDETGQREVIFETVPGTRWEGKMRTQTVEEGVEPNFSKWSPRATLVTKPAPSEIFVKVIPKGPTKADVNWGLPEEYQDWKYGVDIAYKPIRIGGCKATADLRALGAAAEPVVLENVQDKIVPLENLIPGSEYEVTVTLRRPPNLPPNAPFPQKKTTRRFQTEDATPTGAPRNARVESRHDTKLAFAWEPPECVEQNGEISQYEYELSGQDAWNEGTNEGTSPRLRTELTNLLPGSLYRFRVRAFTSAGAGPWSEPVDARTTGSEIGAPRELTAIQTRATSIQLTWLPPHPETSTVVAYRLRYSPRTDDSHPVEVELSGDELSCVGYTSPMLTPENRCATVTGLQPSTTYRFAVQAQAASGNWGPWSADHFSTTRQTDDLTLGGSLRLLSAGHDNLKVKWIPPAVIAETIDDYQLFIAVANAKSADEAKRFNAPGSQTTYHFKALEPVTHYNVTVQGLSHGKRLWFISGIFATTDISQGLLSWLTAPTDLRLIEKSDTMLHVTWNPPEIFEPEYRDLLTHYRVTIAPLDTYTMEQGPARNYTVKVPGNSIRFDDLRPETIYNITVQGGTEIGYGEMIWGTWSTLATGQLHILRLKARTPTTLHVEWDPVWGTAHSGYILTAKSLASIYSGVHLNTIKTFEVPASATDFVIGGLEPATTYNVTLRPRDQNDLAWGVYSTLPPGWYLPKDLKHCDRTNYATSMSWEPVDLNLATHYQVRYIHLNQPRTMWIEEEEKHRKYLLCPKDPCHRLCYLVFNLPNQPEEYAFQVRAKVNGVWNRWKMAARPTVSEPAEVKENCCIVPPPYHVTNIGVSGTWWEVPLAPAPTEQNITRYYVVVDERDPPGDTNWTQLTDKVTAKRLGVPYYVAASYSVETLTEPTTVRLGNGSVIGGYLNYPLEKGKTYNYEIYTKWMLSDNQPVIARLRDVQLWDRLRRVGVIAAPVAGVAFLVLLVAVVLCLLCPCCSIRRKRHHNSDSRRRRRRYVNGQHVPLLHEEKEHGKGEFEDGYARGYRDAGRADAARRRHDDYAQRDDRFHEGYSKGLRDAGHGGMTASTSNLAQRPNSKLGYSAGYMQGFRDGNSGSFGDRITNGLLKRLDEQYPNNDEFRQGYIDGFKEAVSGGRTYEKSISELTERLTSLEKTKGDEIHSTKIYHVYNQTPDVVGYSSTGERLTQELEELTVGGGSRRSTLRRHYTPGDYLKYESDLDGYNSLGRNRRSQSASALARESGVVAASSGLLERQRHLSGTSYISRASGLDRQDGTYSSKRYNYRSRSDVGSPRRYASQTLLDGARPGPSAPTTPHSRKDALQSLQRELDSLSRSPAASATHHGGGYSSDTAQQHASTSYESRETTGSRSHQSRSSASARHAAATASYDYDGGSTLTSKHSTIPSNITGPAPDEVGQEVVVEQTHEPATAAEVFDAAAAGAAAVSEPLTHRHPEIGEPQQHNIVVQRSGGRTTKATTTTTIEPGRHHQQQHRAGKDHNWPDDLIDIVHEPMDQTLSRMRRFSNSISNVERGVGAAAEAGEKELEEVKYHRTYKEEHSSGGY